MQHGFEQVPTGVGHQLQQGLVHSGQGYLGIGGGLAIGQLDMDGDFGLPAHRVAFFIGFDTHVKLVRFRAYANLGQAEPERGLAQIHQRRRCHILAALVPE